MTVNDASLGESGSKLSKVAATSLLMGVTRASSEAYVEAGENGFKAQAVSVVDFDKDGVFNVWEIDQDKNLKETVKD